MSEAGDDRKCDWKYSYKPNSLELEGQDKDRIFSNGAVKPFKEFKRVYIYINCQNNIMGDKKWRPRNKLKCYTGQGVR